MAKITIDMQIAGMERAVINLQGSIDILRGLVAKKARDPIELQMKESWLPELQAALETLKFVKNNQDAIRQAVRK
jgi:hypothetical protein